MDLSGLCRNKPDESVPLLQRGVSECLVYSTISPHALFLWAPWSTKKARARGRVNPLSSSRDSTRVDQQVATELDQLDPHRWRRRDG